jgi:hypothetical protein
MPFPIRIHYYSFLVVPITPERKKERKERKEKKRKGKKGTVQVTVNCTYSFIVPNINFSRGA